MKFFVKDGVCTLSNYKSLAMSQMVVGVFEHVNSPHRDVEALVRDDAGIYDTMPIQIDGTKWVFKLGPRIGISMEES